jgi:hypothetical protein
MGRPGDKTFHGNKNSGRKTLYEEHNKAQALNTLWAKVNDKVKAGKKLTPYEEKLVLALLPKTIKQGVDVSGNLTIKDLISKYGEEKESS